MATGMRKTETETVAVIDEASGRRISIDICRAAVGVFEVIEPGKLKRDGRERGA